jgi:hypothetical protein
LAVGWGVVSVRVLGMEKALAVLWPLAWLSGLPLELRWLLGLV